LSYELLSPQVFRQATFGSTGAAPKTVSLSVLRKLKAPKTHLREQRIIAAQLSNLETETQRFKAICQQKLDALEALKKLLLHQAFSGEP
jgi:type I restriction enzyme S subunit